MDEKSANLKYTVVQSSQAFDTVVLILVTVIIIKIGLETKEGIYPISSMCHTRRDRVN
jgi:hypothetical protein